MLRRFAKAIGVHAKVNKLEAVRLYREAAAAGHPLAKPFLAMTYFFGNGVPQDKTQAEKLTRNTYASVLEVAKNNDPDAQLCLALMYFEGLGVARDTDEALQWLRKSADRNYAPALVNLGAVFALGEGVARMTSRRRSGSAWPPDQNNTAAQTYLGIFYDEGRGVERDEAEAARLWQLAAAQGNAQARAGSSIPVVIACSQIRN